MAIIRIVETDVYCDICGEWITGWRSKETGVSKEWAKTFAREKGCTAGKRIVCKKCRIERIEAETGARSLSGHDGNVFTDDGKPKDIIGASRKHGGTYSLPEHCMDG